MWRIIPTTTTTTTTPHDALFKAGFDTPEQAVGLFKQLLPPSITEALAWETLTRESGSFVDPELRNRHTDLLFSVQLAPRLGADKGGKDRLLQNLDKWRESVREILATPGGRAYIEQWLHYIWLVTPDLDFEEVHAKLLKELPETKEVAMTFAERLEARGQANARVAVLTKQMTLKFGALSKEHAAHLAAATMQQLDAYIERILIASTPEAVFAVD